MNSTTTVVETEGIVLRSINYGERDRILTLFTREHGVLSAFLNSVYSRRKGLQGISTAGIRAEWALKPSRGDCYRCNEARLIDSYPHLRQNLATLHCGAALMHDILSTRLPGESAPQLYDLLCHYLSALSKNLAAPAHRALEASFLLKSLKHEGLMDESLLQNEYKDELEILTNSRTLKTILDLNCSGDLLSWVKKLSRNQREI